MPVAFCLSPTCANDLPPITGLHWWPSTLTTTCWWLSDCYQYDPMDFRLSPEHASWPPPVTSTCWCPSTCHRRMPVPFCLSLACAGGLLPVNGMHWWPSTCQQNDPMAFCLSLVCAGVFLLCHLVWQWPSTFHLHLPVAFRLFSDECWWPPACHSWALVVFHQPPAHAHGLLPVSDAHRWPSPFH